jgi:hypothetical protein
MSKGALLALVAVSVWLVLAVASASAFTPPEFVGAKLPVTFTGTGGAFTIEESGGGKYVCSASTIKGEVVGAKEVANVVLTFSSCGAFCENHTKLWETKPLKGRLAYVSKANRTVGLLLEAGTEPVAECTHFGSPAKIQGSIIGLVGPVNTTQTGPFTLAFSETNGKQAVQHFEGEELLHKLQIQTFGPAIEFGLGGSLSLTMSHALEITA